LFVRYFGGAKKNWRRPRQSAVLIFDASHEMLLREYLGEWSPEVLHLRGELLNIPVFVASLFRKGRRVDTYIDCFIEAVGPRLIVTMIDNNLDFLTVSERHPDVKTLFVQNGWRAYVGDIFATLDGLDPARRDRLTVDYMMPFGTVIGAEYARFVKGRTVPMGSIKNNHALRTQQRQTGLLAFISQWRDAGVTLSGSHYSHEKFFQQTDRPVVEFLSSYARERSKRLVIIPANPKNGASRAREEVYFRGLLGNDAEFMELPGPLSSYHVLDAAEVVVGIDSTLAYESVARGNKTALFCIRSGLLGVPSQKFGWPGDFPAEGEFWTSRPDRESFQRILDRLFEIDEAQWRADVVAANYSSLMLHDPGNSILRSTIEQQLSARHSPITSTVHG
jgi:surface carbohydrate biosynthesis protein